MRAIDVVLAFPAILLAMGLIAVIGAGWINGALAVTIVSIPAFARLARASVLQEKTREYVMAARTVGAGTPRILVRTILPNCLGPLLVQAAFVATWAILLEAALSFLGLGVSPPTPSWGQMLSAGKTILYRAWWYGFFPGLALTLVVLSLNTLGETMQRIVRAGGAACRSSRNEGEGGTAWSGCGSVSSARDTWGGRSRGIVQRASSGRAWSGSPISNPEVAARAAAELGVDAYASAEELLEATATDGLIVATVENDHREPTELAFAAGAGVLVEKPIATTIDDAEQIIAAGERAGRPLLVGHVLRFDARYAQLREIVRSGGIGEPLTIYARRLNGIAAQDRLHGRCSLPLFLGVHDYDIVRWVTGSEVVEVIARARHGFLAGLGADVEDASVALLTLANGVLATVEEGWILPATHPAGFDQRLDVNGSAGRIELVGHEAGLSVMSAERYSWPDTQLWPTVHGEIVGALRRQTWHFVDVLRGAEEPLVSGADGLAALRIALAVEESARSGAAVRL